MVQVNIRSHEQMDADYRATTIESLTVNKLRDGQFYDKLYVKLASAMIQK